MATTSLTLRNDPPRLNDATLLLALTGWMDGGDVSTGTVRRLMEGREAVTHVARIEPAGFYIDNFPGSMEVTALFRPHVRYDRGLVTEFQMAANDFYADAKTNTAFFTGKEPNLNWPGFADCIYDVCGRLGVKRIIFMGSFGGAVPHTREPRLYGSVSERRLLPLLKQHGLRPTEYEGPASFATYLLTRSPGHHVEMLSIAAEIPGYLQGENPLSIAAVTRRLAAMLNLPVDFASLRQASTQWELEVTEAVEKDEKLTETVRQLEEQYDNDLISAAAVD
ncbi:MAG TPA: PAC2 family protein [Tepidisphaeraceae bacterium]|nr:PAC2 family protein [Tepidisphaeraceae bacterium]